MYEAFVVFREHGLEKLTLYYIIFVVAGYTMHDEFVVFSNRVF